MAMLGSSCSPCCNTDPCSCLPETVTLTIDGFSEGETPGRWLCPLALEACYGTGAEARVAEPGGNADTDKGPISAVEVTKGGSGYAKIGRVAPTVTVTGTSGSGTGATFAVTLASSKDACDVDRWAVSKVVRTGGDGYQTGDTLTFSVAEGDTQEVAATAEIAGTIYAEPTLSLSVAGGTGAVLQINGYTKSGDYWDISGITVANGGTGYTNDTLVTVNLGQGDEARPGAGSNLRIRTAFVAPTGEWTLEAYGESFEPSAGTGLALSFTLTRIQASSYWTVNAATITNGGSGYAVGEFVEAYIDFIVTSSVARLEITSVDQDGAVTAISVVDGGEHEGTDTGVIESVAIISQAGWRKVINNPDGVLVTNGGVYYREDASAPAYVSPVTISVTQSPPSAGTGASLSAVIDDDPASETFGQITEVTVDDGGDDYLAYEWCEANLQGTTVVLPRDVLVPEGYIPHPSSCIYGKGDCGRGFAVEYRGASLPPRIILATTCSYELLLYVLEASENVTDCSQIAFTASDDFGRSASVTAGGVPSGTGCSDCAGHVLVNGVQVPLAVFGNGNFTLVSVDSGPTNSTRAIPGGLIPNWWRTYAVAQAVNLGCNVWRGDGAIEILIRVGLWVYGFYNNGPSPPGGYVAGDYDQLTVGSVRANNPVFADYNVVLSQTFDAQNVSPSALEDRLLGPIRGSSCTGNEWHWNGGYDVFDGAGEFNDEQFYFSPGSPRPPSLSLGFKNTRQTERGNVECGPI